MLIGCLATPAASASRLHPNISSISVPRSSTTVARSSMYSNVPASKCHPPGPSHLGAVNRTTSSSHDDYHPYSACPSPSHPYTSIQEGIIHLLIGHPYFPSTSVSSSSICSDVSATKCHFPSPPNLVASDEPGYTIHRRKMSYLIIPSFSSFRIHPKQAEHFAPSSVTFTMIIHPCSSSDFHHFWSGL